jgi:hypothetical protein
MVLPDYRYHTVFIVRLYRLDELGGMSVVHGDPDKALGRSHRTTKDKFMPRASQMLTWAKLDSA